MPADPGSKPPRSPLPEDNQRDWGGGGVASLGFQFAGAMVLCVLVGNWIDGRYKTGPWGVLVGAATGFAVGFYNIFRVVSRQEPKDKAPGPGTRGRDKQ